MTLDNSNIFTQSYSLIKAFLDSIPNLDPRGRYKPNYIHATMPNINGKGFDGYPFFVIRSEINENDKSFDRDTSEKVFRISIVAYSDEPTEVDTISNLIHNNFKSETKLTDFPAREISASPFNFDLDQNGKKISFRNFGIILKKRI